MLKIPQGAAFRHGDGWAVFRVDSGKARLTPVRIGHRGETEVDVLSGLEPGAAVAVHAGDRVKDGARVEARESATPSTSPSVDALNLLPRKSRAPRVSEG